MCVRTADLAPLLGCKWALIGRDRDGYRGLEPDYLGDFECDFFRLKWEWIWGVFVRVFVLGSD